MTTLEIVNAGTIMICPFCDAGDHWNHQREDQAQPTRGPVPIRVGECRAYDTISNQRCVCQAEEKVQ